MPIDKVVLITGSSTGFGRDAAETLARQGYTVFASMRDTSGKNAVHKEALERVAKGENLHLSVPDLDVTNDDSVDAAVKEITGQSGRIDVVINNAGVAALGITEAYTLPQWKQLFEVNLFGVARVNRAVLPTMRQQRNGLIIHVSSLAGRVSGAYFGLYCASKSALEALAEAYRFELKPFGIDSVVVEPGIHKTPMIQHFGAPEDESRIAQYGDGANYTDRVKGVFDRADASDDTPGAAPIVEEFVRLIETPFGERPFRNVPTPAIRPLLQALNATSDELRPVVAQAFNITELI